MKTKDYKVGTIVCVEDDRSSWGTVNTLPDANGLFNITWSSEDEERVHISDFRVVDFEEEQIVATKVQEKLNQARSAFELAFQALQAANDAANESGLGMWFMRHEEMISAGELEGTIDSGGWSSSSLWC